MELDKTKYLQQVSERKTKPGKVNNKEQALVLEIWAYFQKKIAFGQLMTFIKRYGIVNVYEAFNKVRQSDTCKNPPGMFLYFCKQYPLIKKRAVSDNGSTTSLHLARRGSIPRQSTLRF